MPNEQIIDQVIAPIADTQVTTLTKLLADLDIQMVSNIKSANQLNAVTNNSKTFKDYQINAEKAAIASEKVQQAQNKTAETTLKLNEVQARVAAAETARQAKAISEQQKREAQQATFDAKQIAAAEAKAAKLAAIDEKAAARRAATQFPASQQKPNPVTDEPQPGQGAVRYEPVITGQEDMALKATKSTQALAAENVVLLEQQEVLGSLSAAQRANIENLLALQIERAANAEELKKLNVQDAAAGERAVFLTAEQLRLKVAISEVTVELNRQTKEMLAEGGSIKELTVSVDLLRNAYFELSAAERESEQGQKMLANLTALDVQVKRLRMSTGDTAREVGAYEKAIARATNGTVLATQAITIATRTIVRMVVQFALFAVIFKAAEALYDYIRALDMFNPVATEAQRRQQALVDAFTSSDFEKGIENMEKLSANLDLAKQGIGDSDAAINQYNETIGKTYGYVNNLNDAQKGFIDNSDAYIKAVYLEAAAQSIMSESAKEIGEAMAKNQKARNEIAKLSQGGGTVLGIELPNKKLSANEKYYYDREIGGLEREIKDREKRIKAIIANSKAAIENTLKDLDSVAPEGGKVFGSDPAAELRNKIANAELERQKILAQALISNDKLSYKTRLAAVQDFYRASKQIDDNNTALQLSELPKNDARREDIEKEAANKLLQLQISTGNQRKQLLEKQYKQEQDILKNNIQAQKDLFKQVSEDPNQSYSMKLIALDIYNKKSQELIQANYKEQLKEAGKNSQSIKLAEQEKDKSLLQLSNETSQTRIKITKEEVQKVLQASSESEQSQLETLQNGLKMSEKVLADARDKAEDDLAERLAKRKITQRKHDRELLAINDEYNVQLLAQEITAQQAIIAIKEGQRDKNVALLKLDGASDADINKAQSAGDKDVQGSKNTLADLIDRYNKAKSKQKTDLARPDNANKDAEIFALEQTMKAVDELDKLRQKAYENEISRLEKLAQQVDDNAAAEKDAVNNSIASSATKARETAVIDARAKQQKDAIQADENRIKQKEAIADKEAAISKIILETAIAAIKAPAELGPILGLAAVPIVLALGAVELAAAIAAPIPQFAKGGITPGGSVIWGEAGMELAKLPDGSVKYSNGATLEAFPRGTVITPHMQLMQQIRPEPVKYAGGEQVGWKEVVKAIKDNKQDRKRSRVNVKVDLGYESYKRTYLTR